MRNERQDAVCAFARAILAARTRERIDVVARPELEHRTIPAVEELWASSARRYAVEHTRIESFGGQIGNEARLGRLILPVKELLAGRLPGTFILAVNADEAAKASVPYKLAHEEIARLILESAPTLGDGEATWLRSQRLPFTMGLKRRQGRGSQLLVRSVVIGDGEALRLDRVRRAFDDKCPKLTAWAGEDHMSVLILEADDIQLSNVSLVWGAVEEVLAERVDVPDMIVLVETDMSPMQGWVLKDGTNVGDAVPMPNGVRCYSEDQVSEVEPMATENGRP